jgi:2-(1,2-epoxy-1,2-dihydrophenyl)acetyl-CoA isomerase
MEMMLLAEKIPAPQAFDWGLVTRLTEDDAVEESALAIARKLAAGPRHSHALIRKAAWQAADNDFATSLETERQLQKQAGESPDFAEGLAAFREKRPADFQ